ncbi:hypothetical protein M8C21_028407 [Ambrosia artemisiifolia]|uniref:CBS domain-containing protein n=1 Tax=Ambrosia artemisiifolia TaxID=4212 RepID=A0AAD5G7Q8_AMBAR|nr:hypothetical protein M8C21_028407 [Ambrosia artemisiifolia]
MATILQLLQLTSPQYRYATVFDHRYLSSHPSVSHSRRHTLVYAAPAPSFTGKFVPPRNGALNVGDFMTRKDELHVVKPTTTVDEALEALVKHRISGFPVIDDEWNLVNC